ncbi:lysylphosphatidylglycerol synthase transmembrane domain-containing protein [Pseudomonas sp. Marseille-QA0892]
MSSVSGTTHQPSRARRWWPIIKKVLTWAFFIAITVFFIVLARSIDWADVWQSLRGYSPGTIAVAIAVALVGYAFYSTFDLLGRAYTGHHLPAKQIVPLTFVCYAFNQNLAWVGGIAMRYRLYSRLGLTSLVITRILSLSIITNWIGYLMLAGVVFAMGTIQPPPEWDLDFFALRIIGGCMVLASLAYLLACGFSRRRAWSIRGHEIELPSFKMAALQIVLGATCWMFMAATVWVFMPEKVSYLTTLGILLISSIAAVLAHIPGGIGVLETVFVTLLQHEVPRADLLAALIGYRVAYFLVPLMLASLVYLTFESRAKRMRRKNEAPAKA